MRYPLSLQFRTIALAPQIWVTDASGQLIYYVKQKAFKLKEAVTVFADTEQTQALYRIRADRVIDISARYDIEDHSGVSVGAVQRFGMTSFWRAEYEVLGPSGHIVSIREENPWAKVADWLLGEIPIAGLLSGYLFHPAYRVVQAQGATVTMRLVKEPALWEGRFRIEQLEELSPADEVLTLLSLLMLVLLERRRG